MGFLKNLKKSMGISKEKQRQEPDEMPQKEVDLNTSHETINFNDAPKTGDFNPTSEKETIEKTPNFRYLDELIHSGLKEITLDSNIILDDGEEETYENGISVDVENLIINGNDHIIDAKEKVRIFNIEADNVVLKNIKFENGFSSSDGSYGKNGGAICVVKHPLTIEKCVFTNNSAGGNHCSGGAIFNIKSDLNISGTDFIDNYVFEGSGGAIYTSLDDGGLLTLNDCNFESNHINSGRGGAVYIYQSSSIFTTCTFDSNFTYEGDGAAVYNDGADLTLEDCTFESNSAKTPSLDSYYKGYGASVCTKGFLKCDECVFNNNSAIAASAICNYGSHVKILDSRFDDSQSQSASMILQFEKDATLSVENSRFKVTSPKEKIVYVAEGFCYIKNSKLCSNNSEGKAYAVYNDGGDVTLDNARFFDDTNNKLIYNNNTIWIYEKDKLEHLIESTFHSNPIKYLKQGIDDDTKGFTYLQELINKSISGDGSIELKLTEDITLNEQERSFFEGGIELDVDNITIDGQEHVIDAKNLSRVFYITAKNITLKNIVFKNGMYFKNPLDNYETGGGAILSAHNTSFSVINCEFIENESRVSGGAIFNKGEIKSIKECKFIKNSSRQNGTLNSSNCSFSIDNCVFHDNLAMQGGGVYATKGSVTIFDSHFTENLGKMYGGAVFVEKSSLDVKKSEFKRNTIEDGLAGSAIYCTNSPLNIEESIFERNVGLGGAIQINDNNSASYIRKSDFIDNLARSSFSYGTGDAIHIIGNLTEDKCDKLLFLENCTFRGYRPVIIINKYCGIDISSSDFDTHHIIGNDDSAVVVLHGNDIIAEENIIDGKVIIDNEK